MNILRTQEPELPPPPPPAVPPWGEPWPEDADTEQIEPPEEPDPLPMDEE